MIIQMTFTRNECFLLKKMLPIWSKYADGFVFINDDSTDDTLEFLEQNKEKYNILSILNRSDGIANGIKQDSVGRQRLFDVARKYSSKIICLDSDEYLDGASTKEQLEAILDQHPDTTFMCQWIQYTDKNQRRVDSFWRSVFHDRVGNFKEDAQFGKAFSHSSHMPATSRGIKVDPNHLFVAHLQWLDKRWVGIKQYYWKMWDYVNHKEHGVNIINVTDYDASVNNFNWQYEDFPVELKVEPGIYNTQKIKDNYKLQYIVEQTIKHNVPNLGDWGMGIYDYAKKVELETKI